MNYLSTRKNDLAEFDALFDTMFGDWGIRNSKIPSVDISEDEKAYYIDAELAGYDEKDVKVDLDKHVLHISSEKGAEEQKNRKLLLRERNYVKFDRAFSLPDNVNEKEINASFAHGVLTITLPKKPVEQPQRISISFTH